MKKQFVMSSLIASMFGASAFAQQADTTGYVFTTVKENKITPVKNQNRSSTCWSFSGQAFIESELIRMGKGEFDLSDMFVVSHSWRDKADKYVRMHGENNFGPGGSFYDVLYVWKHYGAVPEEVMTGLNYGESMHVHNEMDGLLKAYVDQVIKQKTLTPVWKEGYNSTVDAYLGQLPAKFTYNGKEYTPESFAKSTGLNADDYVSITSYTHHPFYSQFALEIPDNWRWALSYNVPLDEMMEIMYNAVDKGYTIAWGADVSEKGFTRDGIGVVPDVKVDELSGSDQARWLGLSQKEKDAELQKKVGKPTPEKEITQAQRQKEYDNYQTTDDHGMQIYGIAKDQTGKQFFMVKNSWGTDNKYKGTWYVSDNYVRYKTMNYIVHKNALPSHIAKKLGIKQ